MLKKLKAEIEGRHERVKFLWTKAFKVGDTPCAVIVFRTKSKAHPSIRTARWLVQYRAEVVGEHSRNGIVLKSIWK